MKHFLALILAAVMLAGALTACNTAPVEPVDSTTDTTAETTPAETEPEKDEPAYDEATLKSMEAFEVDCGDFILQFEAPSLVYSGDPEDTEWGQHTFPGLMKTTDGMIRVGWQYGEDKVGAKNNVSFAKISANGGKSWVPVAGSVNYEQTRLMANGKYFSGFVSAGTTTEFSTKDYTPAQQWGKEEYTSYMRFFAEDFVNDEAAAEKNIINLRAREYDLETKTTTTFDCTLNWPNAPLNQYPGRIIYTVSGFFGLSGANIICTDEGVLYTAIYCGGFDSEAKTREEAIINEDSFHHSTVYIFESADSGRTWNYISQFIADEELVAESVLVEGTSSGNEGFTEPKMIQMPDGSFFILLRTGSSRTMFCARSTDNCRTWTRPAPFDECGVLPQLLKLDCGVTMASYGRPYLYVRGTADPSGQEWADHVEIPLANDLPAKDYMKKGCFYTGMLALDEDSFIICYTDFNYPNRNGVPVHSVLTRRVHVVLKDTAE